MYFGLPGCGKTTMMTKLALDGVKKYPNVYGNVELAIPGYTFIDNECIGKYELIDALILIDEGALFADNRDYKNFGKPMIEFFMKHRHDNVDIVIFTQQYDGMDKKIRVVTDRVYYVYKTSFFGHWWTKYYRVPYGVHIPKKDSEHLMGQIIQGYYRPSFFYKLFNGGRIFRPKYYKYFDSWERVPRDPLPKKYKPYGGNEDVKRERNKV